MSGTWAIFRIGPAKKPTFCKTADDDRCIALQIDTDKAAQSLHLSANKGGEPAAAFKL